MQVKCKADNKYAMNVTTVLTAGLLALVCLAGVSHAQITSPGSYEKLRIETTNQIRARLTPLLSRFCHESCEIVSVDVDVGETIPDSDDLGFENVLGSSGGGGSQLTINRASVDVQIDERVTTANRERLEVILNNNLRTFGPLTSVRWIPVQLPQIGQLEAVDDELRRSIQQRVWTALQKVIDVYCPQECVLARVNVDGTAITPDQANSLDQRQIERDRSGRNVLKIENIDVEVSMDEGLSESERNRISNVMKAKTRFVEPVNIEVNVSAFPKSFADKRAEQDDPFGLDRLRETLKIFRELAGTKEIITKEQSTLNASTNTNITAKESSQSNSMSSQSNSTNESKASSAESTSNTKGEIQPLEYGMYIGAFLLLSGILVALIMRFAGARKDAQAMMATAMPAGMAGRGRSSESDMIGDGATGASQSDLNAKQLSLKLRRDSLRNELIAIFLQSPKVAKETFSRILLDEGVEHAARYVHIFGHMVVFELLEDPNVQRDIYALSEYYQKARFNFTLEEEIDLLEVLKMRVTANEIRVLSSKQTEFFDFISKLDATQIFNLVHDEKPQIQSIVLTQLDQKRRRSVFEMYHGDSKTALMRELCRADAIPKDFLLNVAKALHKKVLARPEFDTENLRSSDILLDLMERADLAEQRNLMRDLARTNPDAARGIKLKLVTIETLSYLKDGHLLELVLGMDRQNLLVFLAGTREHIRDLFLQKVPGELAQSWVEELEQINGVDEQAYRLEELKIIGRVRQLANNGAINILNVNEMIFDQSSGSEGALGQEAGMDGFHDAAFSSASMVA